MKVALVFLNREPIASRGVGCIASSILSAGHTLDFFDTNYVSLEEIVETVKDNNYDCFLISATTIFHKEILSLTKSIKAVSDVPILLGGIHATILLEETFQEYPSIDYICVGEGEEFVVEFLDALQSGKDVLGIKNLGYRKGNQVAINPVRPCTDLTILPSFRFNIFEPSSIVQPGPLPGFCYVYATRGCPYNCDYCCNGCYLDLYKKSYLRTNSVETVISELLFLKENYPVQFFFFGDEMVLFDKDFVSSLFHRIKTDIGLPYGCMARVEHITPEMVSLLNDTGCKYVGMGVECGDEKFRKEFLNRHMTNQRIIEAFSLLRSIKGITLTSYNMQGYPVPYDDDLTQSTKELNAILKPDIMQLSTFFPFRGTKLYNYCRDHNLIDPEKVKVAEDIFATSVIRRN